MPTAKTECIVNSARVYETWLIPIIAIDAIIAITADVLYEDGFKSVKYHLLWMSVTLSSLIN